MPVITDSLTTSLSSNRTDIIGQSGMSPYTASEAESAFTSRLFASSNIAPEVVEGEQPDEVSSSVATSYEKAYAEFEESSLILNSSQFRVLMELLSLPEMTKETAGKVIAGLEAVNGSDVFNQLQAEYNDLDGEPDGGKYQMSVLKNQLTVTSPFGENSFQIDPQKPSRVLEQIKSSPNDTSVWSKEAVDTIDTYKAYGAAAVMRASP